MARTAKTGKLIKVRQPHLILITGLPGTGKSTLARSLARHLALPLICKDTIKEPLLDLLGAADRSQSRRLSDASFAVMFALARDCLLAGTDVILEGNFRPGEHEAPLSVSVLEANTSGRNDSDTSDPDATIAPAFSPSASAPGTNLNDAPHSVRVTQILCRTPEPVRIARLKARATDPSRHAGHRDAGLADSPAADHAANFAASRAANLAADPTPAPTVAFVSAPAPNPKPDLTVAIPSVPAANSAPDPTSAFESAPATGSSPPASGFLALVGERFVFASDGDSTQLQALLDSLEQRNRDNPHA